MGAFHILCVATNGAKTLAAATFLGTGELVLRHGTVAIDSVFRISNGKGGGPILGGTGAYEGASGTYTFDLKAHTDTLRILP